MPKMSTELRLHGVLDRLEGVLTDENRKLGTDPEFDVRTSNVQKSRCLYELTLLSRTLRPGDLSTPAARRMSDVRSLLVANETKLSAHVEAVRSVTVLIKEAMQAAEADGTYTQDQFRVREKA